MNCKSCGSEISENMKFCTNCGAPVEPEEPKYERVDAEVVGSGSEASFGADTQSSEGSTDYSGNPTLNTVYQNSPLAKDPNAGPIALSIISLVCGILSILCCCCSWFGILCSIAAIVLGIIALNKKSEGKGMAIAGIVCGGIGFLIGGIFLILSAASSNVTDMLGGLGDNFDLGGLEDIIDGLDGL